MRHKKIKRKPKRKISLTLFVLGVGGIFSLLFAHLLKQLTSGGIGKYAMKSIDILILINPILLLGFAIVIVHFRLQKFSWRHY